MPPKGRRYIYTAEEVLLRRATLSERIKKRYHEVIVPNMEYIKHTAIIAALTICSISTGRSSEEVERSRQNNLSVNTRVVLEIMLKCTLRTYPLPDVLLLHIAEFGLFRMKKNKILTSNYKYVKKIMGISFRYDHPESFRVVHESDDLLDKLLDMRGCTSMLTLHIHSFKKISSISNWIVNEIQSANSIKSTETKIKVQNILCYILKMLPKLQMDEKVIQAGELMVFCGILNNTKSITSTFIIPKIPLVRFNYCMGSKFYKV